MLRLARRGVACLGTKYRSFFKSEGFSELVRGSTRSVAVHGERMDGHDPQPAIFLAIFHGRGQRRVFFWLSGMEFKVCLLAPVGLMDARPAFW